MNRYMYYNAYLLTNNFRRELGHKMTYLREAVQRRLKGK